jgi:hypothetical protein
MLHDECSGGDRADPPWAKADPAQGFEGGLEQRVPAFGHRSGGRVQHVDRALLGGQDLTADLRVSLDRADEPVVSPS